MVSQSLGCMSGHLGGWFCPHWNRKQKNTHPLLLDNWDLLSLLVTQSFFSLNGCNCSWSHKCRSLLKSTNRSDFFLHLHHITWANKISSRVHPDTSKPAVEQSSIKKAFEDRVTSIQTTQPHGQGTIEAHCWQIPSAMLFSANPYISDLIRFFRPPWGKKLWRCTRTIRMVLNKADGTWFFHFWKALLDGHQVLENDLPLFGQQEKLQTAQAGGLGLLHTFELSTAAHEGEHSSTGTEGGNKIFLYHSWAKMGNLTLMLHRWWKARFFKLWMKCSTFEH